MSFISQPFWHEPERERPRARKSGLACPVCGRTVHLIGVDPSIAIGIAARIFGVPGEEIIAHRRQAELVRARSFVVWALRTLGVPLSYPKIGKLLDGRDSSSIIHLHEKAILLRLRDPQFAQACADLTERFYKAREHLNG